MRISAVVIVKNEEAALPACLASLNWVDEIIVLDSGSTDRTREIARNAGASVFESDDWPGFGPQKNRAISHATGDWVLSIDADERVTPELASQIRRVVSLPDVVQAYAISRLSSYCGRYMRHSGWWPDYVTRLFRRGKARFTDDLVHERLIVDGGVGKLTGTLLHESFHSLEQVLEKINRYSSLSAEQMSTVGKDGGVAKAVLHGIGAFLKAYVFKAGFLDGREGFMLAVSNAEGAYYKYVKLFLLNRQR
jgi:glycosyltransferase involved in cell wall biosynthesis